MAHEFQTQTDMIALVEGRIQGHPRRGGDLTCTHKTSMMSFVFDARDGVPAKCLLPVDFRTGWCGCERRDSGGKN